MTDTRYGFSKTLKGADFDGTLDRVRAALKEEGFGVLTTIDIQAALKEKIGVDFRRYVILGACNPKLAHGALEAEPQIGLLLPCNVVVQETAANETVVSAVDPRSMFSLVDNPDVQPVAQEVEQRLRRVLDALS